MPNPAATRRSKSIIDPFPLCCPLIRLYSQPKSTRLRCMKSKKAAIAGPPYMLL